MAINRDLNGVLDGDVPPPALQFTQIGGSVIINWPSTQSGFILETTATLLPSAVWSNANNAVDTVNGRNFVTNPLVGGPKFFRLRQQ